MFIPSWLRYRRFLKLVQSFILITRAVTASSCPTGESCNVNVCVLIADQQANEVAYNRYASAIDIAMDHANNNLLYPTNITLKKFHLPETPLSSGPCISACAVPRALALLDAGIHCHIFLGPDTPSSVNGIYGLAYTRNIPILSTAAYGIASRDKAPLLTMMFVNTRDIAQFLVKFLTFRNLTYVAVLHDQKDDIFTSLGNEFYTAYVNYFNESNQTEYTSFRITPMPFHTDVTSDKEILRLLSYAKTKARMIVVFTFFKVFKKILLLANEIGMMASEYQYATVHPYDDSFYGMTDLSDAKHIRDEMVLLELLQRSVLLISLKLRQPRFFSEFQTDVKSLALRKYNYSFSSLELIDAMVTAHYDAVILLASSVKRLHDQGKNFSDGLILSNSLKACTYNGLQTGSVRVDGNGDGQLSYEILGVARNTTEFTTIWAYDSVTESFQKIRELTDEEPVNIPKCGFTGDDPICQNEKRSQDVLTVSLAATIPFIVIVGLIAWLSVRTVSRLKSQLLNPNWWKINSEDLHLPDHKVAVSYTRRSNIFLSPYYYQGVEVAVQDVASFRVQISPEIVAQLNLHRLTSHDHLLRFIGLGFDKTESVIYLVCEHCSKGDLTSMLINGHLTLDWSIKNSFIKDLAHAMAFLHSTAFVSHGNLTSYSCVIDGRLTLKITGYGHPYFRSSQDLMPLKKEKVQRNYEELLWRAPELLRTEMNPNGTQKGDVFSFGIILQQIILETYPYQTPIEVAVLSTFDILLEVASLKIPPMRPSVPRSECPDVLYELMEQCWNERPLKRPLFEKIIKRKFGNQKDNIVDQLIKRMEDYASNLEVQVAEKTVQLVEEKRKSDQLLSLILPKSVAAALIKGETVIPETYDSVTIYFSDIVGFTTISAELTPLQVIEFLNHLYTTFDNVIESFDAYKVETIGDAYMIVSGLPLRNGQKHVTEICLVALNLREEMQNFMPRDLTNRPVQIRIGINTGACVAGVVGLKMPRYCLFGDTVNTASRMESTSQPMKIHITESTKTSLDVVGGFTIERRGNIDVKGKGVMTTFWLISKDFNQDLTDSSKIIM